MGVRDFQNYKGKITFDQNLKVYSCNLSNFYLFFCTSLEWMQWGWTVVAVVMVDGGGSYSGDGGGRRPQRLVLVDDEGVLW